jgi:hypothetical protein
MCANMHVHRVCRKAIIYTGFLCSTWARYTKYNNFNPTLYLIHFPLNNWTSWITNDINGIFISTRVWEVIFRFLWMSAAIKSLDVERMLTTVFHLKTSSCKPNFDRNLWPYTCKSLSMSLRGCKDAKTLHETEHAIQIKFKNIYLFMLNVTVYCGKPTNECIYVQSQLFLLRNPQLITCSPR